MEYFFIAITSRCTLTFGVSSMGEIELFNHLTERKQMTDVKLNF